MERGALLQQWTRPAGETSPDEHLAHEVVAVRIVGVGVDCFLEPRQRLVRSAKGEERLAPDDASLDGARMMLEAARAYLGGAFRRARVEELARELDEDARPRIGLEDALVLFDERR